MNSARKVLFLYLGRRGALGRFTLELAQAARDLPQLQPTFAVSSASEFVSEFAWLGDALLALDTFDRVASPAMVRNFFRARQRLLDRIAVDGITDVITLMPHVWTPLLGRSVRARGARYTTIIHDAVSHPGDPTAAVVPWLRSEARFADRVVTLSRSVADYLIDNGYAERARTRSLFLPDLGYGSVCKARNWTGRNPLRVLFMGRIFKYKGLALLLDAIEQLHREGVRIHLGVAGAGDIEDQRPRLSALDAELINRWLADAEIAPLLARYDAVALPYIEASQSGVAAVASAACMPVIALPSGGLVEQVVEGITGIIAREPTPGAFATALKRLATDPELYATISRSLEETANRRSMRSFLLRLLDDRAADGGIAR